MSNLSLETIKLKIGMWFLSIYVLKKVVKLYAIKHGR